MRRVAARSLAVLVLAAAYSLLGCENDEPLPELAELPSFALVDQRGEPFARADLEGKVWIANFIFTSCPTICPVLSSKMAGLQEELGSQGGELGLVSFSVDPENDTPDVLREYAEKHGYDPALWTWVTGPTRDVNDTIVKGFKLALGEPEPIGVDGQYDIMHSSHFVLIDRTGTIRGYYRSDEEGLADLKRDVKRLVENDER